MQIKIRSNRPPDSNKIKQGVFLLSFSVAGQVGMAQTDESFPWHEFSRGSYFISKRPERNEAEIDGLRRLKLRDMSVPYMREAPGF